MHYRISFSGLRKPSITLFLFLILITIFTTSCRSTKRFSGSRSKKQLIKLIDNSTVLNGVTGLAITDLKTNKLVFDRNADSYFTPASNTKILTLYTALQILGDSIPGLLYANQDTQLIIQGTGHPALLHPDFPTAQNAIFDFLKQHERPIRFCDCNFKDDKYGSGWCWDDYYYSFQSEKSSLPLYGNVATFRKPYIKKPIEVYPEYFHKKVNTVIDSFTQRTTIYRHWDNNQFTVKHLPKSNFTKRERPFRTDAQTIAQLLSDTLAKQVKPCNRMCTTPSFQKIHSTIPATSIYKELMLNSNNFVAEQILLLCANELFDTLNVARSIYWAKDSLFYFMSDNPKWIDGSGLSRYNMVTPRSLVQVLNRLYNQMPPKQVFELFPANGKNGTLKGWLTESEKPFVFAKTGSMRHIFCLSGYLITKSGRTMAFSFMQNNYIGSSSALKAEIEKILKHIHETF